jgi:hypothetical protein
MTKKILSALMALAAFVTTGNAATQTNVLQNINVQLTTYQQGAVASNGKKLANKVTAYSTKTLIAALQTATGVNFGAGAKLVYSTIYSNVSSGGSVDTQTQTNFLTNASGGYIRIGGTTIFGSGFDNDVLLISNNVIVDGNPTGTLTSDVLWLTDGVSSNSVTIDTNAGYETVIFDETNGSGLDNITNIEVDTYFVTNGPTTNVFTNVASGVAVLYGGKANNLYFLSNSPNAAITFSNNSPSIFVQGGFALGTPEADVLSQSDVSIKNLQLAYDTPEGSNNLILNLEGFVKETLKIDTLSGKGASAVIDDITGGTAAWSVVGSGYSGGAFTNNPTSVPILAGYLTNANPVVVQGTVSVSFLMNLAK